MPNGYECVFFGIFLIAATVDIWVFVLEVLVLLFQHLPSFSAIIEALHQTPCMHLPT